MKSANGNELRSCRQPSAIIKIFLEEAFYFREKRARELSVDFGLH